MFGGAGRLANRPGTGDDGAMLDRELAHRRTAFRDWPEPERKRHLVRLWLRDAGRPFYQG